MLFGEIEKLQIREAREREAAADATDIAVKDIHFMLAERYADAAWHLNESNDNIPSIRSGLWSDVAHGSAIDAGKKRLQGL